VKLYHGSNSEFDRVDLKKSRDRRDFGRGFYTTTIREQAEDWARTVCSRRGFGQALLYTFDFEPTEGLRTLIFPGMSGEWLELVKENRLRGGLQHDNDVVKGPVADDNTMATITLYVDGFIDEEAALRQLAYFKVNDQVSLHTAAALGCLVLVDRSRV
jgi:hypothetical protein